MPHNRRNAGSDAAQLARQQEEQRLLARLAELMVEEQTEEGAFAEVLRVKGAEMFRADPEGAEAVLRS